MRNFFYTISIFWAFNIQLIHVYAQEVPRDIQSFQKLTTQIDQLKQNNSQAHQLIIPRLEQLISKADFPYKNFLQSILADEYCAYYLARLQILRENPPTNIDPQNYKTWNAELLSDRIRELYISSLSSKGLLLKTPTKDYQNIFLTSKVAAINQPNLYHVLAVRALTFLQDSRGEIHKGDVAFRIRSRQAFVEADSFISLNLKPLDTLSTAYLAITLYQDLLEISETYESPFPFVYTNIQRLKYVRKSSTGQLQRQRYANALQKMVSPYEKHPVSAEIKYELAKLYIERGQSYMPPGVKTFQWDYKAAFELCREVIQQFPKTQSAQKCKKLIEIIQQKTLALDSEEVQLPNEPFRIKLNFRNVERIYIRIVHLSKMLDKKLEEVEDNQERQLEILRREKSVQSWIQDLPSEQDYQMHAIELPMPELEAGKYILLIGDDPRLSTQGHAVMHARLRVSQLAILRTPMKSQERFRVLNREDGRPLEGVSIKQKEMLSGAEQRFSTDELGSYILDMKEGGKGYQLTFIFGQDSIETEVPRRSFFSSSSNRLISRMYSDSRIYTPGSNIRFRGISYFQDGATRTALTDSTMFVRVINAEQEIIRDTTVEVNQYGSFSGSFRLPENETGHYMLIAQGGSYLFQIKDPEPEHFDLHLRIPEKNYDYWDSVVIKGKIIPFVGADMPETTIKYRVIRQSLFPYWYSNAWWRPELANERVLSARGKTSTDSTGNFEFSFSVIPDLELGVDEDIIYNHTIFVDATSLAGEEHSDTIEVRIGRPKLAVKVIAPVISEIGEPLKLTIKSNDFFGKPRPVEGRLRIFPLIPPPNAYRARQWSQPDMHILDEASYHELFPYDVYGYEDDFRSWKAQAAIVDTIIHTSTDSLVVLEKLTKHLAGKYRIRFDVRDEDSMSLKVVEHINRYNSYASLPPVPTILDYSFSSLEAQPGESIQLGLFTSEPSLWVFVEWGTYDVVDTVITLNLDNFIHSLNIPIKESHKGNFFVRITTVVHNELRTYTQSIRVPWEEKSLKLKYAIEEAQKISVEDSENKGIELLPERIYIHLPHWNRFPYRFSPQNRIFRAIRTQGFSIARAGMISNDWRVNIDQPLLPTEKYHWWADGKKMYTSLGDLKELDEEIWTSERTRMARLNIQGGGGPSALIGLEHDLKARLQNQYTDHLIAEPRLSEKIPRTYITNSLYSSFLSSVSGDRSDFFIKDSTFPLLGKWKLRTVAHDADLRTGVLEKDTLIFRPLEAHIRLPDSLNEGVSWDCHLRIYNYKEAQDTIDVSVISKFYGSTATSEIVFDSKTLILASDNGFRKMTYPIEISQGVDSVQLIVNLIGQQTQITKLFTIPISNFELLNVQAQPLFLKTNRKLKTYFAPLVGTSSANLASTRKYEVILSTSPDYFAKTYLQNLYTSKETDTRTISHKIFAYQGLKRLGRSQSLAKDEIKDLFHLLQKRQTNSGLLSWQPDFKASENLTIESLSTIGWVTEYLFPDWDSQPLSDSLIYPAMISLDSLLIKTSQFEEVEEELWDYLKMRSFFSHIKFESEEVEVTYNELITRHKAEHNHLHTKGKLILAFISANSGDEELAKQILASISLEEALLQNNFLQIAALWMETSFHVPGLLDRDIWIEAVWNQLNNAGEITVQDQIWGSQVLILSKNMSTKLPSFKLKVGKKKVKSLSTDIDLWKMDFSESISPKSSKIKLILKQPQKIWGKLKWQYDSDTTQIKKDISYNFKTELVKEKSLLLFHIHAKEDLKQKVISYKCTPEVVPEASRKMLDLELTQIYAETSLREVKLYLDDLPKGTYTIEIPLVE